MDSFRQTLTRWQQQPATFSSVAWQNFIRRQAPFAFSSATLPVDEALWGSFWQGDVIAPGYLLPALELAYLRATRLDEGSAVSSPAEYLQDLQATLSRQPGGVWLAPFPGGPALCIAYAGSPGIWQFIWLAGRSIVAGYRDRPTAEPGRRLIPIHTVQIASPPPQTDYPLPPLDDWAEEWPALNRATRIDRLVRLQRAYSHLVGTSAGRRLGSWLDEHPV